MNPKPSMLWLVAGLAVAGAGTTFVAQAVKPGHAPQQHKAAIQSIRNNHHKFKATQPRTMAQGNATTVRMPDGKSTARVPTVLWSDLAAQKDAQGNLHVIERSGDAPPPTSTQAEGLENE